MGKALAALKTTTDTKKVEALATLMGEEAAGIERLRENLSKNPTKAAAEQTVKADNVKRLIEAVNSLPTKTADQTLLTVAIAANEALLKREAARLPAEKALPVSRWPASAAPFGEHCGIAPAATRRRSRIPGSRFRHRLRTPIACSASRRWQMRQGRA
ncbi:hypothetical protein [Pigmentiphaga litoralis]|uniref:hypothetical protein n=1 Tax=Pigmentiphaga litoralis TaxID=516702 RepID=UPI00389A0076